MSRALLHVGSDSSWYTCLLGTIKCTGSGEPGAPDDPAAAGVAASPLPVWRSQQLSAGGGTDGGGLQAHVIVVVGE